MIADVITMLLIVGIGALLIIVLKKMSKLEEEISKITKTKVQNMQITQTEKQNMQTDESPFLNEKGLYSYDAYDTKMKLKYDHPKNVIEV